MPESSKFNRRATDYRGRSRRNRGRIHTFGKSTNRQYLNDDTQTECQKILVLHGSRQTGQLLLGRMDKLKKNLKKQNLKLQLVAPDAPFDHPEDDNLRQWWERHEDEYRGLDISLGMLQDMWETGSFVGILGFSQGARLAHLIALYHQHAKSENLPRVPFHGLQCVILVAGYDAPVPQNWISALQGCAPALSNTVDFTSMKIDIPSLHIWGANDSLITPAESHVAMKSYQNATTHEHDGGHHVPMKASSLSAYIDFLKRFLPTNNFDQIESNTENATIALPPGSTESESGPALPSTTRNEKSHPDEQTAQAQQDEVEALSAIFPDETTIVSKVTMNDETGDNVYSYPISYRIALHPEDPNNGLNRWPPCPLFLSVTYPYNYPSDDALPDIQLLHENNVMEFSSARAAACQRAMREAAEAERGMPCVLSCVYAARECLDSGEDITASLADEEILGGTKQSETEGFLNDEGNEALNSAGPSSLLKIASKERIQRCNMEGLAIAEDLLGRAPKTVSNSVLNEAPLLSGKGGSWLYTVGLVGKPSAGKSTFFNTASAFARQRDDADNVLGGATMAPHPFTTIDPNIGFCLVPAPKGSCPEEDMDKSGSRAICIGSSHGRDSQGRRLLPVLLKDVAGLVPGAFQGRGRGNKFLNDLTDADVLIHVVDASGRADAGGNVISSNEDEDGGQVTHPSDLLPSSQPLEDLAWIRNELVEWVFANLVFKWDSVLRRGRSKLWGLFSGYGQSQAVVTDVLLAVERYMEKVEKREKALDNMRDWDTGDVHRLVSAFLGVRFPMALALNKYDMPSSEKHVKDIQEALPLHGAHIGVPLSARLEMNFIRYHLLRSTKSQSTEYNNVQEERRIPLGTWQCLQSAMSLREPVLVFPVTNMSTYQPLAGMMKYATSDPSLPSAKMISCLQAAGGCIPTLWDTTQNAYSSNNTGHHDKNQPALRDVLIMKPGSTVEDVFNSLKRLGALSGEFVRAESAGCVGDKAKLVSKSALVGKSCRILKIMTTKRTQWQHQYTGLSAKK